MEKQKMNLSSWRHDNLYKSKNILHAHEEVQERLEIRSINKGFVWQSTSPWYCQPNDEWEEDMDWWSWIGNTIICGDCILDKVYGGTWFYNRSSVPIKDGDKSWA